MEVFVELLKGFGRFFLHPLTYVLLLIAFLIGMMRVKKERSYFSTRIFNVMDDVKLSVVDGLFVGVLLSIVTGIVGVAVPLSFIVLMAIVYLLFAITFRIQWMTPSFVIGLSLLITILLPDTGEATGTVGRFLGDLHETNLPVVIGLLAVMVLGEGWLIWKKGPKQTSPLLIKSSRGKMIGAHELKRMWLVPVLLFIPVQDGLATFSYWPVLHIYDLHLTPIIVPFGFGIHVVMKHVLPKQALEKSGRQVMLLGIVLLLLAVLSYYLPFFIIIAMMTAIVGREAIIVIQKLADQGPNAYFSTRKNGLVILGIIPFSSAEKMGLEIGEVIIKVNGQTIASEQQFYEALQLNSAFCKLEVLDVRGEVRFASSAVYNNEHHELGLLFVKG